MTSLLFLSDLFSSSITMSLNELADFPSPIAKEARKDKFYLNLWIELP